MNIDVIISLIVALIAIGAREGLVLRDIRNGVSDDDAMLQKWWHRAGAFIRGMIILAVFLAAKESLHLSSRWILGGIAFLISSVWYNIAINLIEGDKWYKLGTSADTDRILRKIFFFINFDK